MWDFGKKLIYKAVLGGTNSIRSEYCRIEKNMPVFIRQNQ